MKHLAVKFFILSFCFFSGAHAQEIKRSIPAPTKAEAKSIFDINSVSIKKDLEERTGYKFSQLKLVEDLLEWGKTYSVEAEYYKHKWPEDLISNYWLFETPKDSEGLYKRIAVYVWYRRTDCSLTNCLITNKYKPYDIYVGKAEFHGIKQLTNGELESIALDYFKSGKADYFSNVIQIDKIEATDSYDIDPKRKKVQFRIHGTVGVFNQDKTTLIHTEKGSLMFTLDIASKSSKWEVDSFETMEQILSLEHREWSYEVNSLKDFYESYSKAGFDAIYQKKKKSDKPSGMDERFLERTKAFYEMVKTKGYKITKQDVEAFKHKNVSYPSSLLGEDDFDAEYKRMMSYSYFVAPVHIKIKEAWIKMDDVKMSDGSYLRVPVGKVSASADVEGYKVKNGNITGKPLAKDNFEKFSSWVYIDNEWYILTPGEFYFKPL